MDKTEVAVAGTLEYALYMQAAEVIGAKRENLDYVISFAINVLYFQRYHDAHCWYSHMVSNFKNKHLCAKRSGHIKSEVYKRSLEQCISYSSICINLIVVDSGSSSSNHSGKLIQEENFFRTGSREWLAKGRSFSNVLAKSDLHWKIR
ncbi:hypothetical protein Bca4012_036611 [Brassica carinata]|uniref:Uncharacterized protein n=1 Tax=Brassica carinata TaxID=52824 RepID=A0A8X7WCI0_BRACI|nr:hypothetical protein Bca52824_010329 [Brassica carinata]